MKKDYIWSPAACSCKNGKYLASIIDDLVITCDETIDVEAVSNDKETKTVRTLFSEKNQSVKHKKFYILLSFLLISIALLIAVSIFCCFIEYWAKQKNLLPFHDANNKQETFYINKCIIKMKSNDTLKKIDIRNCTCYYFDDITKWMIFTLITF